MKRVNKFNIHWQLVRVNARAVKNVEDKIRFVINFLYENQNIHNYGRVYNWLKMTRLGYKELDRKLFDNALEEIVSARHGYEFASEEDNDNDLSRVSKEDLLKVYKDLSKRKYNFQYKSVPVEHVKFMDKLKEYL
tara:strand:- start:3867 stop:4271 length:405 start_codon:yes stop_codon:yes gene_type:complete